MVTSVINISGEYVPVPDQSEIDRVAAVLYWLRLQYPLNLRTEESFEIRGQRRYSDIGVYRAEVLICIVEVKKPERFRTEKQRGSARKQVEDYASERRCLFVAWTDGVTVFTRNQATGAIEEGRIVFEPGGTKNVEAAPASSPFRIAISVEQHATFPEQQRKKAPLIVQPELYVHRDPIDFTLRSFVSSSEIRKLILGAPDLGKSAYAQHLAADSSWNALYIDGASINTGILPFLEAEVLEIIGFTVPIRPFLTDVATLLRNGTGQCLGFVFDSFDEYFASSQATAASDLARFMRFAQDIDARVIVLSRESSSVIFHNHTQLRSLFEPAKISHLEPLKDDDFERFISKYFSVRAIGGTLTGRAREICRTPGMLDMVTQTYEKRPFVDPELTEPQLYHEYRSFKIAKMNRHRAIAAVRVNGALSRIAGDMRSLDRFVLSVSGLEERIPSNILEVLLDEHILVPVSAAPGESYVRFRYGGFRDFLIFEYNQREGRTLEQLVTLASDFDASLVHDDD